MRCRLLVLTGCIGAEDKDGVPTTYHVGGDFTGNATREDQEAFTQAMQARCNEIVYLEKWPLGFDVTCGTMEACREARADTMNFTFVQRVRECRAFKPDPDTDKDTGVHNVSDEER